MSEPVQTGTQQQDKPARCANCHYYEHGSIRTGDFVCVNHVIESSTHCDAADDTNIWSEFRPPATFCCTQYAEKIEKKRRKRRSAAPSLR